MTFEGLVKSLVLPAGFRAPTELVHDDLRATALSRADLEADVRGINDSLELIRRTRGVGWPTEPVTEEIDYVDLVWHELEFREGYSFSYAVYDTSGATWAAAISTRSAGAPRSPSSCSPTTST